MAATISIERTVVLETRSVEPRPVVFARPLAPNNNQPAPAPPSRSTCKGCVCTVIFVIIVTVIISALINFFRSLAYHPTVPQIRVDSLFVSHFNISYYNELTAVWVVGLYVQNSNKKMSMYYDGLQTDLLYRDYSLSQISLEPIYLGKMNDTSVNATLEAHSDYVDEWVVDDMAWDQSGGVVSFNVRMQGSVKFAAKSWQKSKSIEVYCGNLKIGLSNVTGAGELINNATECLVSM